MNKEDADRIFEKVDSYLQDKSGLSLEEAYWVTLLLHEKYAEKIREELLGLEEEDLTEDVEEDDFDFVEDEATEEEDDEALQEAEAEDDDIDDEEEAAPVPTVVRQQTQTQSQPRPQTSSPQVKQVKKVNIISLLKKPVVSRRTGPKAPPKVDG